MDVNSDSGITGTITNRTGRSGLISARNAQKSNASSGAGRAGFKEMLQATLLPSRESGQGSKEVSEAGQSNLVCLGTISSETPTVSHLLYQSSFKKKCWAIIHSDVNSDKPFRSIRPGTRIFMDPQTRELVWGKDVASEGATIARKEPEAPAGFRPEILETKESMGACDSPDMVNAVRPFIGTGYDKMDCFELLVSGLQNLGIQYKGRGGLGERLVQKAVNSGQARNRYINGEGLVKTTAANVFEKRIMAVKNPEKEAEQVMAEMAPLLHEGQILSFSMRTRGHTGVVSQRDGLWTFINSGTLDNAISRTRIYRGVGEENLQAELKNWLRLAREKKEGIQITVGALNMDLLSSFTRDRSKGTEKA